MADRGANLAEKQSLASICQPAVATDDPVVILGPAPKEITEHWPTAATQQPESDLSQRYELALLVDPHLLASTETTAVQLLAAARDRWARQVLVLIPVQSAEQIPEQEFFALGFSRRHLPASLQGEYTAYGFSITRYKPTPDWLNAKYWANPERWNKN